MMKNRTLQTTCRTAAILLTGLLLLGCLGGCGDAEESSSESSGETVEMEDLEYGVTMREDDSLAVPVEYDKRFLETAEVQAVAQYYDSIQNEDTEEFEACTVDFYMEYYLNNVYGGILDNSAFLAQQNESLQDAIDGDDTVTISLLSITDCQEETEDDTNVSTLKEMFNELEGENYCTTHWKGCKTLTIQLTLTDGTTYSQGDEVSLFVVQLDDSYYVCA